MRAWAVLLLLLSAAACKSSGKEGEPASAEAEKNWEADVEFVGIKQSSRSRLFLSAARELKSFRSRGRRPADAADAAYSMELYLREEGYAHAKVDFQVSRHLLLFLIDEGPRVRFGKVEFVHHDAIPDEDLAEFFAFAGSGLLGTGPIYYREGQVLGAAAELEKYYLLNGYYEVEVGKPRVTFNETRTQADVRVEILAGRLFTVDAVECVGIDPAEFGAHTELDVEGKPYYRRLPAEIAARVRGKLYEAGHQFCKVTSSAEVDHETATARLRIEVEPGPQVRLREVHFEGLDRTAESFARRRIPLDRDEIMRQELLDAGLSELYRAAIFSSVRPTLRPVEGEPGYADLMIELRELKARAVSVEAGWGSYEQLRGAIRFTERNLFGHGRRLSVDLAGSMRGYSGELRVADPWLLGKRDVLEVGGLYGFREEPSFDRNTTRFDIQVRHRFPARWRMRLGYQFKAERAGNITGAIDPEVEDELTQTAGFFAILRRDMRDNPLIPNSGNVAEISAFWSDEMWGASLNFVGLRGSVAQFWQLGKDSVLGINLSAATKIPTDDRITLPIQERLFLGGPSTVRSFRKDLLGPTNEFNQPTGGLTAAFASVEWRRKVWRDLHIATFFDVGLVDPQALTFRFKPGYGVGAGLRYYLPIGPIRFDVAYNPGELFAESSRWAFNLAVGFSF